jgi:DNA-directed RNA polymerase subunit RPC12/RpoP
MSQSTIDCPACGAPIDSQARFQDSIDCPYCGTQSFIGDSTKAISSDSPGGEDAHATLANVYTRFHVGQMGTIIVGGEKADFTISGRVQFEYEGGFWSEWYMEIDNQGYWLQEDEGVYILFIELPIENDSLVDSLFEQYTDEPDSFRAGKVMPIFNGRMSEWHLLESGTAKLSGREGNLPNPPEEGKEIIYFDGCGGGFRYNIEIEDKGKDATLHQGWPIQFEEITAEEHPGAEYGF